MRRRERLLGKFPSIGGVIRLRRMGVGPIPGKLSRSEPTPSVRRGGRTATPPLEGISHPLMPAAYCPGGCFGDSLLGQCGIRVAIRCRPILRDFRLGPDIYVSKITGRTNGRLEVCLNK